jgi:hypothetical protein
MKIEGLPVIESDEITVAVRADDLLEGDATDPERHPHRDCLTSAKRQSSTGSGAGRAAP